MDRSMDRSIDRFFPGKGVGPGFSLCVVGEASHWTWFVKESADYRCTEIGFFRKLIDKNRPGGICFEIQVPLGAKKKLFRNSISGPSGPQNARGVIVF